MDDVKVAFAKRAFARAIKKIDPKLNPSIEEIEAREVKGKFICRWSMDDGYTIGGIFHPQNNDGSCGKILITGHSIKEHPYWKIEYVTRTLCVELV